MKVYGTSRSLQCFLSLVKHRQYFSVVHSPGKENVCLPTEAACQVRLQIFVNVIVLTQQRLVWQKLAWDGLQNCYWVWWQDREVFNCNQSYIPFLKRNQASAEYLGGISSKCSSEEKLWIYGFSTYFRFYRYSSEGQASVGSKVLDTLVWERNNSSSIYLHWATNFLLCFLDPREKSDLCRLFVA